MSAILDWTSFFEEKKISRVAPPFGLPCAELPTTKEIDQSKKELSISLPKDYEHYCTQIGAGQLGRIRLYVPYFSYSSVDIRFHNFRLKQKFAEPEFQNESNKVQFQDLIIFGSDKYEDFGYGWNVGGDESTREHIYCFDENNPKMKPVKLCNSFTDFIKKVALGNLIQHLGLMKSNVGDEEEDEEEDSDEFEPELVFRPSPAR